MPCRYIFVNDCMSEFFHRLLLYIDRDLEDNSILPLMPDNGGDVVQVGFTCDSYPPGQSYLSGVISSLTYLRNSVYRDQVFGEGNKEQM